MSNFHKNIATVNRLFSIVRKGQLIVKDTSKVKQILKMDQIENHAGPKTASRNRYKKIENL